MNEDNVSGQAADCCIHAATRTCSGHLCKPIRWLPWASVSAVPPAWDRWGSTSPTA